MIHHNAPRMGRPTAALIFALVAGSACSVEHADELPRSDPDGSALTTPTEIGDASQCTSHINDSGLLCSRCPGDAPGAAPECLAATCQVDQRSLVCTDPKGRVGVDSSVDYSKFVTDYYTDRPSGGTFNFATCTFLFGVPKSSGTTCYYPSANTCERTEEDGFQCLSCRYPDGGSLKACGPENDPLYDPLYDPMMGRPEDLPAPGFCTNDLSADGQVQCTTCMHDDLSATRSCHYPGIVECAISDLGITREDDNCVGRCTYEDGHQVRMCESPSGVHPVPLP